MSTEQRLLAVEDGLKQMGIVQKSVLTFEEAASYMGMSRSYLYKLTATKQIPHYKPGGKMLFFERAELEAWLLSRRVDTTDEVSAQAQIHCMGKRKGRV